MTAFIQDFSNRVEPLRKLVSKGNKFEWKSEQVEGFRQINIELKNDNVMAYWSPTEKKHTKQLMHCPMPLMRFCNKYN